MSQTNPPQPPSPVKGALAALVAAFLLVLVQLGIITTEQAAAWTTSIDPWLNLAAMVLGIVILFLPRVQDLWKRDKQ